jgi:hypothetical protein
MGLFKKFFSIRGRRSKKRSAVDPCTQSLPPVQEHLKPSQVDDTEAAVSRLLRSSSGRFAEPLIALGSLPPLREFARSHSLVFNIQSLIQRTPSTRSFLLQNRRLQLLPVFLLVAPTPSPSIVAPYTAVPSSPMRTLQWM